MDLSVSHWMSSYTLPSTITHTRSSHQHKILPILVNKSPFYHSFLYTKNYPTLEQFILNWSIIVGWL